MRIAVYNHYGIEMGMEMKMEMEIDGSKRLYQAREGFTLLELSIVLVVVGLVIGGITVGQSLIRSAELNSVIRDVNKYRVAINSFKLKYNSLPGDMDNADSYWPPPLCVAHYVVMPEQCNGNGNGIMGDYLNEGIRSWQHLSLSELI